MKVKEAYIKQLEDDFELDLAYEEFLRDTVIEPVDAELDEMEEEFTKNPSTENSRIITNKPLNNIDYYPLSLA